MAEEQRIVSTHEGMSPLWITLLNQMRDQIGKIPIVLQQFYSVLVFLHNIPSFLSPAISELSCTCFLCSCFKNLRMLFGIDQELVHINVLLSAVQYLEKGKLM